jgi:signal transduction histidine kinase/HPt (histidine-containing phosphotransfer) domain-containing protein
MASLERTYRLLIVDDDETDRRLYGWLLARQAPGAFEIEQARDGAEGITALRERNFDCLLLDFSLPDLTGLEFLVEAIVDGELPCAVVLITGHGNEAIAVEAMKIGVQDYLVKDHVNEGRLWRAIVRAVSQRELRVRLAQSMRALTAANATLEQEVDAHKQTEIELRTARDQAEQANQAKTRFVAMVTHELRTPLNGILGYAQLLRLEGGLSASQNARVGGMLQAGRHLFGMIERLLDFASIESGRMQLHPARISVRDLTEACLAAVGPAAAERGLGLRLVCQHDAPRQIVADPARLRQVLLNLLGNAVKFTGSGDIELRIVAARPRGALRIEVADTGPGISATSREKLFQDFERLDAPASIEGAGLGLAISARFVGLMGGAIGYLPNPGRGSIFWLELPPAAADSPSPGEAAKGEAAKGEAANAEPARVGGSVLLVDDIAMNRDIISAFLRAAGYDVTLADGGREAVQLASEQSFDLILMDVRMPEMDGLEAARLIRALPAPHGELPILALTAYHFPDQIAQCQMAGMNGHVTKPVDYALLTQAVVNAMSCPPADWIEEIAEARHARAEAPSPPRLDRAVLDQLLAFLPPEELAPNMRSLRARMEQMVELMDRAEQVAMDDPERAMLMDTAHALASASGLFGFTALAVAARDFEHAVAADTEDVMLAARRLYDEIHDAPLAEVSCQAAVVSEAVPIHPASS